MKYSLHVVLVKTHTIRVVVFLADIACHDSDVMRPSRKKHRGLVGDFRLVAQP